MNKHLFRPQLNGSKLSNTLSLLSTIEFVLGIVSGIFAFLFFFIIGILLAVNTNSVAAFLVMFLGGIIGGLSIFFLSFVFSVLLKGFAAVVLHTYISALNSEH